MGIRSAWATEQDQEWMWPILEQLRTSPLYRDQALTDLLARYDGPMGWREVEVLASTVLRRDWIDTSPALVQLCAGLRHDAPPFARVLDPHSNGTLIEALVDQGVASQGHGLTPDEGTRRIHSLMRTRNCSLETGDERGRADWLTRHGPADLIVSMNHIGTRHDPGPDPDDFRRSENRILIESVRHLTQDGKAVLVMPATWFLGGNEPARVRERLAESGLAVQAAFLLPRGTVGAAHGYAVVVGKAGQGDMFVAELTDDRDRNEEVLQNFRQGQSGASTAMGSTLAADGFRGLDRLLQEEEHEELLTGLRRAAAGRTTTLGDISDICRASQLPTEEQNAPEIVFINTMPIRQRVATGFAEVEDQLKGDRPDGNPRVVRARLDRWVAARLDTSRARPDYVAAFLRSGYGKRVLDSLSSGYVVQRIRNQDMPRLPIVLPSIEDQGRLMQLEARLRSLRENAETIRGQLWDPQADLLAIKSQVDSLESPAAQDAGARNLEEWIRELPYPLASILRRYHVQRNDDEQAAQQLVYFFEGFSLFRATIFLSALQQGEGIPSTRTAELRAYIEAVHMLPLERSSIGTWNHIGGSLASYFRGLLSPAADADAVDLGNYFPLDDPRLVQGLTGKRVASILQEAGRLRGDGSAHGGLRSRERWREQHDALLALAHELRNQLGDVFQSLKLIRASMGETIPGNNRYQCEVLAGSDPLFEQTSMTFEEPLDVRQIHLVGTSKKALPLIPFVQMAAPQEDPSACYFYRSRDGDQAEFVSYHQQSNEPHFSSAPLDFLERWNTDPEPRP